MPTLQPLHLRPLLTALALAASTATAEPYESAYDDPFVIKPIGYNGKVYCLCGNLEAGSDFSSCL